MATSSQKMWNSLQAIGNIFRQLDFFFFLSFSVTWLPQFLFSPLQFRQLGCHNCFFFFSPATWLPQSFFSPLTSLEFQQLSYHNWFFFLSSASPLGTSSIGQLNLGKKNFGNFITEIQFFSHSTVTSFLSPQSPK